MDSKITEEKISLDNTMFNYIVRVAQGDSEINFMT